MIILLAAAAAGVVAFRLQFDPCVTSMLVALGGLVVIALLVTARAREQLAESRARLMREAQMCPICGYTIRAATDRCPECGVPVPSPGTPGEG